MRTKVLNHFHTFHPEAQEQIRELMAEEVRLTREKASRAEGMDPPKKQRMSEPVEDIDAKIEDVRARLEEQREVVKSGVVRIIVKGLTRGEFRRLLVAHPPREDDDLDQRLGYNGDTFPDALIQASILRTESQNGEPVDNDWDAWADDMTNGQYEEVFTACMKLTNDGNPTVFPR